MDPPGPRGRTTTRAMTAHAILSWTRNGDVRIVARLNPNLSMIITTAAWTRTWTWSVVGTISTFSFCLSIILPALFRPLPFVMGGLLLHFCVQGIGIRPINTVQRNRWPHVLSRRGGVRPHPDSGRGAQTGAGNAGSQHGASDQVSQARDRRQDDVVRSNGRARRN